MNHHTPSSDSMILAHQHDGIGWLEINNPAKRNAISLAMWADISAAARGFRDDPAVRAVVVHGRGGQSFAAGADISEFEKNRADAQAETHYAQVSFGAREDLMGLGKPLIAMIDGFCIGGGCALSLVADLRIASSDSQFGIPAARLGVSYSQDSLRRLVALVGPSVAKDIMYTGRRLGAEEALRIGLINQVVPKDELRPTVEALVRGIARNAPLSIRASKASIDQIAGTVPRDEQQLLDLDKACFDSLDYREGRRAFMEKRQPAFQGR